MFFMNTPAVPQIYITTILRKITIFLILQAGISICIAMSLHNLFLR